MNQFRRLLAAASTVVVAVLASQAAHATLTMRLDDLNTVGVDVVVTDGGAGDSNAMAGVITYNGGAGGWTINVSTALGTTVLPNFGVDLNSVNVGTGGLRISFSENNIMAGVSGPTSLVSAIGGVTAGSLSYALYADDANVLFGTGTGSPVFAGAAAGAFSSSGGGSVALTDPFSLTMQVDISHKGFGATSFNFESKVPEPASLALLGVAMLGLGAAARRRRA